MRANVVRLATPAVVAVAVLSACSAAPTQTPSTVSPTNTGDDGRVALVAYSRFWAVVDGAQAAPTAKDWDTELNSVAIGQALSSARTDIANDASIPAHVVGTVTRTPSVATATPDSVSIDDCVDLGDSKLVSDTDGSTLDDVENGSKRFRLRAEVRRQNDGGWRVVTTSPALDEKC